MEAFQEEVVDLVSTFDTVHQMVIRLHFSILRSNTNTTRTDIFLQYVIYTTRTGFLLEKTDFLQEVLLHLFILKFVSVDRKLKSFSLVIS